MGAYQVAEVAKQLTYEAWCNEHGATEHLLGTCLKCMPAWLRPRRDSTVTPTAVRNRILKVAG
jgi:hypothetical protein